MTNPLPYANVQALAYAVQRAMEKADFSGSSARPWNPYEALNCRWWVMPSTDFPAYHHGKFVLQPDFPSAGSVFCGIEIEKGFGEVIRSVPGSSAERRCIMQPDWIWHEFSKASVGGQVDAALEQVHAKADGPVLLGLNAYLYGGGDFDPYETPKDDRVLFAWTPDGLVLNEEGTSIGRGLLASVSEVDSTAEAITAINSLEQEEWVWLDVYVGVERHLDSKMHDAEGSVVGELWRDVLSPLIPWFH